MNAALLYKPSSRWLIASAFLLAGLIHLGAIVLAAYEPSRGGIPNIDDTAVVGEIVAPTDEPPPPASEEMIPPPTISNETWLQDETPAPPPRKRTESAVRPLVRLSSAGQPTALHSGNVRALNAPRLEYPYEARRQRLTGSGVALLSINPANGVVVEVAMLRSTGNAILDNAAINGFRRWRFQPGTAAKVQTPITFTLTGVSF